MTKLRITKKPKQPIMMKRIDLLSRFFVLALAGFMLSACVKQNSLVITPYQYGEVIITFSHTVHGASLKFDTMGYSTSLDNHYQVSELQYFVSRVSFHRVKDKWQDVTSDNGIHYTDGRDNYSCSWWLDDPLPAGDYDTVAFTFGLDEKQNITGRFPDPPQRDMFWPEPLGGGYHYMKLNLKWQNDTLSQPLPFMFHLGIGQVYAPGSVSPDSIIGFVQNYFRVLLPCSLKLNAGGHHQVIVQMDLARWFDGQNAFNFADYPNGIMQDQEGMFRACMNGRKAFSIIIPK